eukprot:13778146-Heterocapsa_arctica.AAC.1
MVHPSRNDNSSGPGSYAGAKAGALTIIKVRGRRGEAWEPKHPSLPGNSVVVAVAVAVVVVV